MVGNFVAYQAVWFACVLGAAAGQPVWGLLAAAAAAIFHLASAPAPLAELRLLLLTGAIGGVWETWLVSTGWVRYEGAALADLPPVWIIALWVAFATTFNVCLRWLQGRPTAAALLGFLGGPAAWWAGASLGALELSAPKASLFVIGLGWAALMPLLMALASRLAPAASHTGERLT
jgi:hypothetical protein